MLCQSLEITTIIPCPLQCRYCPQEKLTAAYAIRLKDRAREGKGTDGTSQKVLSYDRFVSILAKIPTDVRIDFSGMTEPFANARAVEMLFYAASQGYKIAVYSTFQNLKQADIERMGRELVFEDVAIHVPDRKKNAPFPGDMAKYSDRVDLVIRTIRSKTTIEINSHGEIDPVIDAVVRKHEGKIRRHTELHDRAGNVMHLPLRHVYNYGPNGSCWASGQEFNRNVLLPNGDVLVCCMSYSMDRVLGNLTEMTYDEMRTGEAMKELKRALGTESEYFICRKCYWFTFHRKDDD